MKHVIFPGSDDVLIEMFSEISDLKDKNNIVERGMYLKYDIQISNIRNKLSYHKPWSNFFIKILDSLTFNISKLPQYIEENEEICMIFSNLTIRLIPRYILKKLISKKNIHIVVYFIDSTSQELSKEALSICQKFQLKNVYTFDKDDAERYGFKHFYYIYSPIFNNELKEDRLKKEVTFFGADKGRLKLLLKCAEFFDKNNIDYLMSIVGVDYPSQYKQDKIIYNSPMPYSKMIEMISEVDCLLDVVIDNQAGLSLRAMEAVCYNKKLITNNRKIFEFPFYNQEYMLFFDEISDIDPKFIEKKVDVNYYYKNEYSPYTFLSTVDSDIIKMKGH